VPLADLADTQIPCHVVTTDLMTGAPCWWSSGDPVTVLTASACLPAVFPPVPLGDSLHVDGGVTRPVPLQRALELGADRTWVIDVSGGSIGRRDERMNALDVLLLSFAISRPTSTATRSCCDRSSGSCGCRASTSARSSCATSAQTPRLIDAGYAAGLEAVRAEAAAGVPRARRSG
jgi:NTE family protein